MKKTKIFVILMLAVFVSLTLVFTPSCKNKIEEQKIIKIGAILPLTGNLAWLGVGEKNGMELAKEKINKNGGILNNKLEIIYEDSQGDPKLALSAVNKLISVDNAKFILVSTTGCANVIIPVIEKEGALEFAITIDPKITDRSQNIFRVWVSDDQQWSLIAQYLNKKKSMYNKIGIIRVNNEYGINSKKSFFEYLGQDINIAFDEEHPLGEKDFKNIISKIKSKKIDGIVLMEYANDLVNLVKQLKENGVNTQLFGNIDFIFDFVKKSLFELADGVIFTAPGFSIGKVSPLGEEFIAKYSEKFKKDVSWNEAYSYDNILILVEAFRRVGTTEPMKVKNALHTIKNFPGVTGDITVLANGDTTTTLYIVKYKNKKIEIIEN